MEAFPHDMPESAAHLVPDHRATDRAADREADAGNLIDPVPALQVQDESGPSSTITAPDGRRELFSPPHPMAGRQHDRRCQTATRERPLPRRAERIARPARVRMRSRKPCLRCRRRLFGW
jgi:hypothetical protein